MKAITDKVLEVIEVLKANGTIRFYADVYHVLEMDKGNFNSVKNNRYDFTVKQVSTFINHYNVNSNFIFKNSPKMWDTNSTQTVKKSEFSIFSNNI
jgi:hypothetical protein